MGINVIVSNASEIVHINAGEPEESHRASVEEYDKVYRFRTAEKADIVICGSTAPTDHLFFHTSWAVVNVDPITKDNGTILFASPCPGYGAWEGFALMDLLKAYMPASPEHNEMALKDFYSHKNELWAGCIWYKVYEVMVRKSCEYITYDENLDFTRNVDWLPPDRQTSRRHSTACWRNTGPTPRWPMCPMAATLCWILKYNVDISILNRI